MTRTPRYLSFITVILAFLALSLTPFGAQAAQLPHGQEFQTSLLLLATLLGKLIS
jgi:hypothetical protein